MLRPSSRKARGGLGGGSQRRRGAAHGHDAARGGPEGRDVDRRRRMDAAGAMKEAGAVFITEGVGVHSTHRRNVEGGSQRKPRGRPRVLFGLVALVIRRRLRAARGSSGVIAALRLTLKEAAALALKQNHSGHRQSQSCRERSAHERVASRVAAPRFRWRRRFRDPRERRASSRPPFPGSRSISAVLDSSGRNAFSVPVFDLALWRRWQASRESVHLSGGTRHRS